MHTTITLLACLACLGHGRRVQTSVSQMHVEAADAVPSSQSLAEVNAAFTPSAISSHLPAGSHSLGASQAPLTAMGSTAINGPAQGLGEGSPSHASLRTSPNMFDRPGRNFPTKEHKELITEMGAKPTGATSQPSKAAMKMAPAQENAGHWWNRAETLSFACAAMALIMVLAFMLGEKAGPFKFLGYGIGIGLALLSSIIDHIFLRKPASADTASDATGDRTATGWRALPAGHSRVASPVMQETTTKERFIVDNVGNNVRPHIVELVGKNLHNTSNHPLGIIKEKILAYFNSLEGDDFEMIDDLDPLVRAQECFDDLLIPTDHPGRKPADTYYVTRDGGVEVSSSEDTLLRTHTSAHQSTLMREGKERFLCTGDVYRRDEIDRSHFPVFHQMEGVKLFDPELVGGEMTREEWLESPGCKLIADDLKKTLEGMCDALFGPVEKRWIDEYFPFTEPSFELEIFYNGDWMEVLGCGVIHSGVLEKVGKPERHGWAFGLGLERLAMVLFTIPDIRLFWSDDQRFCGQFKAGEITTFKPFSNYSPVFKDIAFWIPEGYVSNDFFELARGVCGELVEKIDITDEFTNPKKGKTSHCYRITYRSMERTLTNEEINEIQEKLRSEVEGKLGVELR